MELGVSTFVDLHPGVSAQQRMRDLLEEAELAEQVGLDVFAVGEHHRPDFVVSSPSTALAAIAARTSTIRLSSAVTVLSSDDPIRVFQQFSTVDLISDGRAEIMAGRGSFTESFPLFGYDLERYDELFVEKLEALLAIREGRPVNGVGVYPRPVQDPLPVWIAVGGTPNSVARAGVLGLPLMIAIIGGMPERFAPLVQLYKDALERGGHDAATPFGTNSHTYVADTSQRAADEYFGPYSAMMSRIGRERGWPPMNRDAYEQLRSPRGAVIAGSPQEVAEKILFQHETFGHHRFLAQISVGNLPHAQVMRAIELLGTEVAPIVRDEVARRRATAGATA